MDMMDKTNLIGKMGTEERMEDCFGIILAWFVSSTHLTTFGIHV